MVGSDPCAEAVLGAGDLAGVATVSEGTDTAGSSHQGADTVQDERNRINSWCARLPSGYRHDNLSMHLTSTTSLGMKRGELRMHAILNGIHAYILLFTLGLDIGETMRGAHTAA